jgi:hypothetical protein
MGSMKPHFFFLEQKISCLNYMVWNSDTCEDFGGAEGHFELIMNGVRGNILSVYERGISPEWKEDLWFPDLCFSAPVRFHSEVTIGGGVEEVS